MIETFRCIYCNKEKPKSERSLEHVWPEGLGGEHAPDFFKTRDVCGRCNNLLGQFVDGGFQRSFFIGSEGMQSALAFLDTNAPAALHAVYMGVYPEPPNADEICEAWIGPRGERIFYIHKKDRYDFDTYAGGDPIRRHRDDVGRVYLSFSKPNAYWIACAVLTVRKVFKKAELRFLTKTDWVELNALCTPESDLSARDRTYLDKYWREKAAHVKQVIDANFGFRFQCKLAIGFGHTLFGDGFSSTAYAGELRRGLWERDPIELRDVRLSGTSFLTSGESNGIASILGYPGAYTHAFSGGADGAMLFTYSPSQREMRTGLLPPDQRLESQTLRAFGGSFVVLLFPFLKRAIGPMALTDYVVHRSGGPKVAALAEVDNIRKSIDEIERDVAKWHVSP